jgi:hypothetical protein
MTKVVRAAVLTVGPKWSNIGAPTPCDSAHPQRVLQLLDAPAL